MFTMAAIARWRRHEHRDHDARRTRRHGGSWIEFDGRTTEVVERSRMEHLSAGGWRPDRRRGADLCGRRANYVDPIPSHAMAGNSSAATHGKHDDIPAWCGGS